MRFICFLVLTIFLNTCFSQWTDDPENPLVISDAPGFQRYAEVLEDGSGGWYVFWGDSPLANRAGTIYGQHLDQDGYSLWEPNGQFILDHPNGNVISYEVKAMSSGEMLFVYSTGNGSLLPGDSLQAMLIGTDGSQLWSEPLVVGRTEGIIGRFHQPAIIPSGTGALIAYYVQIIGGAFQTRIDRIDLDGSLLVGVNGQQIVTSNHGPMGLLTDGNDGALIHWRNSNGGGTHMGVYRFDSECTPLWTGIVDPVADSAGLYWEYEAISDGQGGVAIVFDESGNETQFLRLDGDGNQLLTPAIKPVAPITSTQSLPHILMHDNAFFVCWEDDRPPANNRDLYMQKLDMNGDPEWASEGVLVVQGNTYIPHAAMVPTDSGGVMVAQLMSGDGFVGQRVRSDGTTAWTEYGQFCTSPLVPFYAEFQLMPDVQDGVVAFWYNQNNQDLYAAKLSFNGNNEPSGIGEWPSSEASLVYPNPGSGVFQLNTELIESGTLLRIHDAVGRKILQLGIGAQNKQIDLSDLKPGLYFIIAEQADREWSQRLVIQ